MKTIEQDLKRRDEKKANFLVKKKLIKKETKKKIE